VLLTIEFYIIRLLTMKLFTKTLFAAAMLAGVAGAAQASIKTGSIDAEAFLQVYDKTQGLTYDLDLGSQASLANLKLTPTLSYDLSADANWVSFASNLDPANTKFGVVVGYNTQAAWTTLTTPTPPKGAAFQTIANAIKGQALNINNGTVLADTAANLSKVVADTATIKTGEWSAGSAPGINTLASLYGTYNVNGANASVPFGTDAPFYMLVTSGTGVTATLSPNVWSLSTTGLTFAAPTPAAVPLPAAVWMFGAGLLSMLGLNRRKLAA
jgi:hypothetical protein